MAWETEMIITLPKRLTIVGKNVLKMGTLVKNPGRTGKGVRGVHFGARENSYKNHRKGSNPQWSSQEGI